jgi:hypothetical protein
MTSLSSVQAPSALLLRSHLRLTRDIASLSISDLDFNQSLTHVQVNCRSHEVMASNTGDELAERLDERTRLDGTDACGREERGKGKVRLR